jgi:hypothetical protein
MEANQPRIYPAVFPLMDTDFKVTFDRPEAVRTALENFFHELDNDPAYDCRSTTDNWNVSTTVYTVHSCALVEAAINRTDIINVYVIHLIYADYLDRYLFNKVKDKMIIYFTNNIYQACDHSRSALERAQERNQGFNPFMNGFGQAFMAPERIREMAIETINHETPQLRSIYFEINLAASQSISSFVKDQEFLTIVGELIAADYAAYQIYQVQQQADYVVGMTILCVDTVLKYAIGRQVHDGGISMETRTMCAYILSTLATNVNCANILRAINAIRGIELALEALENNAHNYVLIKKLRLAGEILRPID